MAAAPLLDIAEPTRIDRRLDSPNDDEHDRACIRYADCSELECLANVYRLGLPSTSVLRHALASEHARLVVVRSGVGPKLAQLNFPGERVGPPLTRTWGQLSLLEPLGSTSCGVSYVK